MKAYIARDESGAVTSGWLLRNGTEIHPTLWRLRRTQIEEVVAQEASVETMLCNASRKEAQPRR
ncbi:hypothetical protein ACO2I3_21220 [Leptospira interrogans]